MITDAEYLDIVIKVGIIFTFVKCDRFYPRNADFLRHELASREGILLSGQDFLAHMAECGFEIKRTRKGFYIKCNFIDKLP